MTPRLLPMNTIQTSIYDFPTYYDLVFGSDTAAEMKFLEKCFTKFVDGKVRRVFEPACGTGRLIYRMGQRKLEVGGNDLHETAVAFCNRRLERNDLKGRAVVDDMSDFTIKRPYDAAFNTINSFRHLLTEEQARGHLECMAHAVRPGGIYALGLHLTPTRGPATDYESWSARRGQLSINTSMWPIEKKPKKRLERFGISFDVYKPSGSQKIEDVLELRSYTASQLEELIASVPLWTICEWYDFGYDADQPIQLKSTTEDVVVILKRTA